MIGPKNRPADLNARAFSVVQDAISESPPQSEPLSVVSGRKGGLKGGPARAAALTPERRSQIAKQARAARRKGA